MSAAEMPNCRFTRAGQLAKLESPQQVTPQVASHCTSLKKGSEHCPRTLARWHSAKLRRSPVLHLGSVALATDLVPNGSGKSRHL